MANIEIIAFIWMFKRFAVKSAQSDVSRLFLQPPRIIQVIRRTPEGMATFGFIGVCIATYIHIMSRSEPRREGSRVLRAVIIGTSPRGSRNCIVIQERREAGRFSERQFQLPLTIWRRRRHIIMAVAPDSLFQVRFQIYCPPRFAVRTRDLSALKSRAALNRTKLSLTLLAGRFESTDCSSAHS